MIKINLLGDTTKIDHTNRFLIFGFATMLLFTLVICYRLYNQTQLEITQYNLKMASLKEQLATLEKRTKVVKDLEVKKAEIRAKLLVLAKLRKNRMGPVKVLNDLNISLPETVWLQSVKEGEGTSLELKGRALDNQNIALFIKQIQESNYFTNVDLKESKQVYFSKKLGTFSSSPDEAAKDSAGKFSSRNKDVVRSGAISENNVRVKEFIIMAEFSYAGMKAARKDEVAEEEEVQFPELAELEDL